MNDLNFTAIDFETANDRRSSACSIGLAVVRNGVIVDTYYRLIKPYPFEVGYWQHQVHGLTIEDLKDQAEFAEIWKEIQPFINDQILVAHNASFDRSVLSHVLEHHGINVALPDFCCTYQLSKAIWPTQISYKLSVIASLLNLDLDHHNALSDAVVAAQVGIEIMRKKEGVSLDSLVINPYKRKKTSAPRFSGDPVKFSFDSAPFEKSKKEAEIRQKTFFPDMEEDDQHPFYQKSIVFTGGLARMERETAKKLVNQIGAVFCEGLTKKTNILVNAGIDQKFGVEQLMSSKARKAKELKEKGQDIEILTELEFYTLLGI